MKRLLALNLLILTAGCTTRELVLPGGGSYKSTRIGNKEAIGEVEVRNPDGTVFILRNFASDQVEALRQIAAGVAEGTAKGMK